MRRAAFVALWLTAGFIVVAKGGHELPIYPSYYPHEIKIETVAPAEAASLLAAGRLQAYVGAMANEDAASDAIGFVESLGAFLVARLNPASSLASADASACDVMGAALAVLQGQGKGFIAHPYPVTPYHGDYLHHADLAAAARQRLSAPAAPPARLRIKTIGEAARRLIGGQQPEDEPEWDVAVEAVDAADVVRAAMTAVNGWLGPPWAKSGWFHATILLANGTAAPGRAATFRQRLMTDDVADAIERLNLERELVQALTADCKRIVLGYTLKREPISTEFSAGIENVAYDAIEGLVSPMFLRTVKLKDFPWNGWLALGVDGAPTAAWNPIGGMDDRFGRLMWFAASDAAAIPSPYDADWVLNRIAGVEAVPPP
jgi:hypothetical protein